MAFFAVIENNTVVNTIVANTLADAEAITKLTCVEYQVPVIGATYVDGKFSHPSYEHFISDEVNVEYGYTTKEGVIVEESTVTE